jgi:hypothetical protein
MNANKCKCMYFILSKFRTYGRYNIDINPVPHTDYIKLLGVFVVFNLSWNDHVEATREKCVKLLGFVNRNLTVSLLPYVNYISP